MALAAAGVLGLALGLDLLLGDPPNRYHPVAWLGRGLAGACRLAPRSCPGGLLVWGAGLVLAGLAVTVAGALALEHGLRRLPWPLAWLAEAWLLKLTLAVRGLARAAHQVRQALEGGQLCRARQLLGWHLVSRPTAGLPAPHVAAATIESVAENTADGVLAPLWYYVWGGLPAAWAYRFVNTADAMLGYRHGEFYWLGKAAARLDDLANLVPSRLTALLLVLAALLGREQGCQAWRVWRRDARLTASPNAGQPMSAMAGALGRELEKVGHYRLGAGLPLPVAADIARAVRLMYMTVALGVALLAALALWR
ncbi:MAG: cobalamin biosynthesis protein CobD [Candidatus Tectimicrobiota bacterium]|nr:MAG: cobalamin biosynthesis protein CobD [Candidatus Tectomicrobia bacterium]